MKRTNRRVGCGRAPEEGTDRDGFLGQCLPAIREAHPPEHIAGDREREQGRPDVDVKRVEPHRRRGHPSERADSHGVEDEDQSGAGGGPGKAPPPRHGIGQDGAQAQRQRVGPAALERDRDRQGRGAEQSQSHGPLRPGERKHGMRFGPVQTEQAEEAEAPRHGPERESNGVRQAAGRVRRHGGSPVR